MTYDIVHNGWTLNEHPIHENDLLDKLAKWKPLFEPLEVRESEASYSRHATQLERNHRRRQRALEQLP